MADSLRLVLSDPAVVDAMPPEHRVTVERHRVTGIEEVGWLDAPPAARPTAILALEVQERLDRAARAEFVEGNREAAARLFRTLLDAGALAGRDRHAVVLRAAWHAHRSGDTTWRDTLLDDLADARAPSRISTLLLRTLSRGALSGDALARAARLREPLLEPLASRLREHGIDPAPLTAQAARIQLRRRVLRAARDHLARRVRGVTLQEDLLAVTFLDDRGSGIGMAIEPEAFLAALRRPAGPELPTISWSGEPVLGELPSTADVVVPGALGVLPRQVERTAGSPWPFALVIAGLAMVFTTGMLLSVRALRREALANRVRAEFLTTVTHELKTPLAAIRLLAEMLEQGRVRDRDRRNEYHALLSGEAARLTMLIENVLDLGRMDRGERSYDIRGQSVEDVVAEAVQLMRPVCARDGVEIKMRLQDPPAWADLDRGAMLQALLNILDNARKFGPFGGCIEVITFTRRGKHEILIRDHGPGIPKTEREGVFLRFKRGSEHQDGSIPGVGLGLYLARTILRRHGGELRYIKPWDEGGACFRFTLPLLATQPVSAPRPLAQVPLPRRKEAE